MSNIKELVIQLKNTTEKIRQQYLYPGDFSFADGQATQRRLGLYKKAIGWSVLLAGGGVLHQALSNSQESSGLVIGVGVVAATTFGLFYLIDVNHLQRGDKE